MTTMTTMTTITIKGKDYQLRLTTRTMVQLEKAIGKNPIQVFMDTEKGVLPQLGDIVSIFHASLQALNHGISLDAAYDLFDEYLAEGHSEFDMIATFIEVFKDGGFLGNAEEAEPKN